MRVVSPLASLKPAPLVDPLFLCWSTSRAMAKKDNKIFIDEDATRKEVTVGSFSPQGYKIEKSGLLYFRLKSETSPRAASQKLENDLRKSSRAKKDQYAAGPMNVASSASGMLGAMNSENMLDQRGV